MFRISFPCFPYQFFVHCPLSEPFIIGVGVAHHEVVITSFSLVVSFFRVECDAYAFRFRFPSFLWCRVYVLGFVSLLGSYTSCRTLVGIPPVGSSDIWTSALTVNLYVPLTTKNEGAHISTTI